MSAVQVVSSFHDDEFFRLWGVALLLAYMVDDANSRGCGSHEERWKTAYRSLFIEGGKAKRIPISELIEILDNYRGRWEGFREHSFEATIKPDLPNAAE